MNEIGFAGGSFLTFMLAGRKQVSATQQIEICLFMVHGHFIDDVFNPEYLSAHRVGRRVFRKDDYNKKVMSRPERLDITNWKLFAWSLGSLFLGRESRLLGLFSLSLLVSYTQLRSAFQCRLVLLLIFRFSGRIALHLRQLRSLQKQVGLIRPCGLVIGIILNSILCFRKTLLNTHLRSVEFLLLLRFLVRDRGLISTGIDSGYLIRGQFGNLKRTVRILAREHDIGLGSFLRFGRVAVSARRNPLSQFLVVLGGATEIGNGIISFIAFGIVRENSLISLDRCLSFSKVLRALYAGTILRMKRARNKHRGSFVIGI